MAEIDDFETGTIVNFNGKAGYIVSDRDRSLVYFSASDVVKDAGLGVARANQRVQFILPRDSNSKPVADEKTGKPAAKLITVMQARAQKMVKK